MTFRSYPTRRIRVPFTQFRVFRAQKKNQTILPKLCTQTRSLVSLGLIQEPNFFRSNDYICQIQSRYLDNAKFCRLKSDWQSVQQKGSTENQPFSSKACRVSCVAVDIKYSGLALSTILINCIIAVLSEEHNPVSTL